MHRHVALALVPLLWLSTALVAQRPAAALGADEAPVLWVDSRPMLRVTLRAGEQVYYCHLLLDLSTQQGLYLHRNAAGSLRAQSCDVECGGITLRDVDFTARRDTWLEGLTATFAEELQQVPVAGILGLSAFGERDVELDGPRATLRVRGATSAAGDAPPASPSLVPVAIAGERRDELRLWVELEQDQRARFALHTRDPFCWIDPTLAQKVGHPDGVLRRATAAQFLDFAQWAPFRPLASQSGLQGGIGGAVLQQMVVTVQPVARRVLFALPAPPDYPETEAAFYRALYGNKGTDGLQAFLKEHPTAPEAAEAATALFLRLQEGGGDAGALQQAGMLVIEAAAANKKGTTALEVLEKMPRERAAWPARQAIAERGLAGSRADEDGNAAHKLRLELGTLARASGDVAGARRHLLAAVFGMPISGVANLELGHWHRDQGQHEQALGRYFLAMLDMKNTGQQGYAAFAESFAKARGPEADMLATLVDMADGRVPSFQPIPRDPATVQKTGRAVLVELFTGAMCPPCVAADVAVDGIGQLFDPDEVVVVQWHLPIPAPEPMVAPCSLERGEAYGISGTPTVVFAGGERIVGGGKADAAPDMFLRYRTEVERLLQQQPSLQIAGDARLEGDVVEVRSWIVAGAQPPKASLRLHVVLTEDLVVFPGSNGILFHHHVARARLGPAAGSPLATLDQPLVLKADLAVIGRNLDDQVAEYETRDRFLVRPVRPDPRRLHVVCFVQEGSTGAVHQVATFPLRQP